MNKEELILRIQDLEDLNLQQEARLQETKTEFKKVSKLLENINKPVVTNRVIDEIYQAITRSFEDFDIDEYHPEYSFGIDYNNQIVIESTELCISEFADQVHDAVLGIFNIVDDE
tara:strand:- start:3820 stop:4164 length:345 start_codon:yes stop_codon:yes gene_type:complete